MRGISATDSQRNIEWTPVAPPPAKDASPRRQLLLLFLASFVALYFELVIIRYLSTEVRVFAYLKNLPLVASFFGLGLGMALGKLSKALRRGFVFIAVALFIVIAHAPALRLTHLPFPNAVLDRADYFVWGLEAATGSPLLGVLRYLAAVCAILALVVAFFVVLGRMVGEYLALTPALRGYGVNLAGSLAGIVVFTLLSFSTLPPVIWVLIGFLAMAPFFLRDRLAMVVFSFCLLAIAVPQPNVFWSPYYRIGLNKLVSPVGWPRPSAYSLNVNYDYHQKIVDLSPAFIARYPGCEPNRSAFSTYELPYRLVGKPGEVLVVGAGTGNDVAAALRHGATHVDAVEIDPVISRLGMRYHPERPYDSPRVSLHVDDARAFFKKARKLAKSYDLIVFGYLDSHTLLTSFSSVRLDNYVYTLESFQEARSLLKENGSLILGFASGRSFVTDRLFATLMRAFSVPPRAYFTGYDGDGVVFLEGAAAKAPSLPDFPERTEELKSASSAALLATDHWPFLYLAGRTVPVSILLVLVAFLWGSLKLLRRTLGLPILRKRENLHLFLLGAGFLLLETKGVTELSLLFGSTWIVNAVVIGAFLVMALLANSLVMRTPVRRGVAYGGLFLFLGLGMIFPYASLDSLPGAGKVLAAGILVGLPVFCSGMIFSGSFRGAVRPSEALGVNLLGAVVGGILENTVMLGGVPLLGYLALLIYGLSAVVASKGTS